MRSEYAETLQEQSSEHCAADLVEAAEALLLLPVRASPTLEGLTREIRMFVLKSVERASGVGTVRRLVGGDSPAWVRQWRESGDRPLLRFAGATSLPKHNPLSRMEGFGPLHTAVCGVLSTGDTAPLQNLVTRSDGNVGALAASLFHEIYLGGCVDATAHADEAAPIRQWLSESPELQERIAAPERALLLSFARSPPPTASETWCGCTPRSTPQQVLLTRVGAHVLAASLASTRSGLLALFRSLLTASPHGSAAAPPSESAQGGAQTEASRRVVSSLYLPCMPEDSAWYARRVMGGKWYRCPQVKLRLQR